MSGRKTDAAAQQAPSRPAATDAALIGTRSPAPSKRLTASGISPSEKSTTSCCEKHYLEFLHE